MNLAMIGVAIRQTGKASRSRKAGKTFNPDDYQELRKHFECIVLLQPSEPEHGFPADDSHEDSIVQQAEKAMAVRLDALRLSNQTAVQNRLVEANLRRRHRFLLAQKRSQKIKNYQPKGSEDTKVAAHSLHMPAPVTISPSLFAQNNTPETRIPGAAKHIQTLVDISDLTKASTAEGTLKYDMKRAAREASTVAQSQISFIASGTESQNHRCELKTLPVQVFESSTEWKRHLIGDLCPYTCVSEHCPEPQRTYTTKKAWEAHMEKDHPIQWRCVLCEEDLVFWLQGGMEQHIATDHEPGMDTHSLETLLSWSEIQPMGIRSCPLCSSYGPEDSSELLNHIVRHAYEFALRSLPWHDLPKESLYKPVGAYTVPEDKDDRDWLQKWLETLKSDTADPRLQLSSDFELGDSTLLLTQGNQTDEDYFDYNSYFDDHDAEKISKILSRRRSFGSLSEIGDELLEIEDDDEEQPAFAFALYVQTCSKIGIIIADEEATADQQGPSLLELPEKLATGRSPNNQKELSYYIFNTRLSSTRTIASSSTDQFVRVIESFTQFRVNDANLPLHKAAALPVFPSGHWGEYFWITFDEHQYRFIPCKLAQTHIASSSSRVYLPPGAWRSDFSISWAYYRGGPQVQGQIHKRPARRQVYRERQIFLDYHGTFGQNGKEFILLECANRGTLHDLFSSEDTSTSREELYNLWENFLNIVKGLWHLVRISTGGYRFGHSIFEPCWRLEPASIHVFEHGHELGYTFNIDISDFDLLNINKDTSETTQWAASEYYDLELDKPTDGRLRTGKAYIWSLGCLFFDMLVWAVCGNRGLREFSQLRKASLENIPLLGELGSGAAYHNGTERLDVVDKMLKPIIARRPVFDNLTEPLSKYVLGHMLVPMELRKSLDAIETDLRSLLAERRVLGTREPLPDGIITDQNFNYQDTASECLKRRDFIFIVDDTETMRNAHWDTMSSIVQALFILLKDCDPNNIIELWFTSNPDKSIKGGKGNNKSIFNALEKARHWKSTISDSFRLSLNRILSRVKSNIQPTNTSRDSARSRLSAIFSRPTKEFSIYILTDAMWDDGHTSDDSPGAAEPIETLIREMKRCNRSLTEVSIQFIQMGDNQEATKRLKYLDESLWKKFGDRPK
ncbi:hypothetical protein QBC38DRAFT_439599 [Podospora fimiseda]|uniref:Protein kinase domain-containing protein n=1 Tax=Podospora fimiseda TaxID=252190 RepID=A0AAN7BYE4_9PEZI|nr:hypothetical protein QBC38DRAFT_439599 [Podospora fimiseda]